MMRSSSGLLTAEKLMSLNRWCKKPEPGAWQTSQADFSLASVRRANFLWLDIQQPELDLNEKSGG
jgi:hypothetical protein